MQRRWLPYPILNGCTMALDDLDQLPFSPYRDHLKSCNDCQTSLWQFFDIRFTGRIVSRCDQTTVWVSLKITCREEVGSLYKSDPLRFFR